MLGSVNLNHWASPRTASEHLLLYVGIRFCAGFRAAEKLIRSTIVFYSR
jgi:hypothetical protein